VKGAPHPEAAKKLIDYLLSRQVEERLAKSTAAQMPLHRDVSVPPNVKPVSPIKDMALTYPTPRKTNDGIPPYPPQLSGPCRTSVNGVVPAEVAAFLTLATGAVASGKYLRRADCRGPTAGADRGRRGR